MDDTYFFNSKFKNIGATGSHSALENYAYCERLNDTKNRDDHLAGGLVGFDGTEADLINQAMDTAKPQRERKDRLKNGQQSTRPTTIFRSSHFHIPSTVSDPAKFAHEYAEYLSKKFGCPCGYSVHDPKKKDGEPRNIHCHIRLYARETEPTAKTYSKKNKTCRIFRDKKLCSETFTEINNHLAEMINRETELTKKTTKKVSAKSNQTRLLEGENIAEPQRPVPKNYEAMMKRKFPNKSINEIRSEYRAKKKPTLAQKKFETAKKSRAIPEWLAIKYGLKKEEYKDFLKFQKSLIELDKMAGLLTSQEAYLQNQKIIQLEKITKNGYQQNFECMKRLKTHDLTNIQKFALAIKNKLSNQSNKNIIENIIIRAARDVLKLKNPEQTKTEQHTPQVPTPEKMSSPKESRWTKHTTHKAPAQNEPKKAPRWFKQSAAKAAPPEKPFVLPTVPPEPVLRPFPTEAPKPTGETAPAPNKSRLIKTPELTKPILEQREQTPAKRAPWFKNGPAKKHEDEETSPVVKKEPVKPKEPDLIEINRQLKKKQDEEIFDKLKKGQKISIKEFKSLDEKTRKEFLVLKEKLDRIKKPEPITKKPQVKQKKRNDFVR